MKSATRLSDRAIGRLLVLTSYLVIGANFYQYSGIFKNVVTPLWSVIASFLALFTLNTGFKILQTLDKQEKNK